MKMVDYIRELDNILQSTGRKLLSDAGKISHEKATEKAALEYHEYKAKNLSDVEKAYLETIKTAQKKVEKKAKDANYRGTIVLIPKKMVEKDEAKERIFNMVETVWKKNKNVSAEEVGKEVIEAIKTVRSQKGK